MGVCGAAGVHAPPAAPEVTRRPSLPGSQWAHDLQTKAEAAAKALDSALRSPNGWLEDHFPDGVIDTAADPDGSEPRAQSLRQLQRQCVPELVRLMHRVLLETGRALRDVGYANRSLHYLAELVADEHYQLFRHFDQERMRELLGLLRRSALVVIELQPDDAAATA